MLPTVNLALEQRVCYAFSKKGRINNSVATPMSVQVLVWLIIVPLSYDFTTSSFIDIVMQQHKNNPMENRKLCSSKRQSADLLDINSVYTLNHYMVSLCAVLLLLVIRQMH